MKVNTPYIECVGIYNLREGKHIFFFGAPYIHERNKFNIDKTTFT